MSFRQKRASRIDVLFWERPSPIFYVAGYWFYMQSSIENSTTLNLELFYLIRSIFKQLDQGVMISR